MNSGCPFGSLVGYNNATTSSLHLLLQQQVADVNMFGTLVKSWTSPWFAETLSNANIISRRDLAAISSCV